ncbi:hypothetical protein JCM8547_002952 [Rhodosporidiobolus lusitaniae]
MDYSQASSFDRPAKGVIASQEFANLVLGPSAIGWTGQLVLFGVAAGWTVDYLRSPLFRQDTPKRRALLLFAATVCTVQAAFNFYLIFRWTTMQDRPSEEILKPSTINSLQPLTTGLIGIPIQAFLASRSIALLHTKWKKRLAFSFFVLIFLLESAAIIFNVTLNLLFHHERLTGKLLELVTYNVIQGIWLIIAAVADVAVSAILVCVLRKKIVGFSGATDAKLRALCRLAVQSACYTALAAIAGAVTSYATPNRDLRFSALAFAFWYLLPSLYLISLLLALSSRLILAGAPLNGHPHQSGLPTFTLEHSPLTGAQPLSQFAGTPNGRRSPYARSATPSPNRLRDLEIEREMEKQRRGILVEERVSVEVDEDGAERERARSRALRPDVPRALAGTPVLAKEVEPRRESGTSMMSESDGDTRKSSWASSAA